MNKPDKYIMHHAVSSKVHTAENVDDWHKERWPGFTSKHFKNKRGEYYHVGYHFVIEWDGLVVQCRGLDEEGAHCYGQNSTSIGVCFMGNNDLHLPSAAQLESWKKLYQTLQPSYPHITPGKVFPHRNYANKSCHGKLLPDNYYGMLVAISDEELRIQLTERVKQLQNRLKALLTGRRMK